VRPWPTRFLLLLVPVWSLLLNGCKEPSVEHRTPSVAKGELNLGAWDLAAEPVRLVGEWRVRFADVDGAARPNFADHTWELRNVVGHWQTTGLSYDGVAWYRLHIQMSSGQTDHAEPLALYLPFIDAASEIYWNGRLIGSAGRIGADGILVRPGARIDIYPLQPQDLSESNVLAIRMRSIDTMGGISKSELLLGTYAGVRQRFEFQLIEAAMVAFAALAIAIYHFAVFLLRRQDRYNLYFALCALTAAQFIMGWNAVGTRLWDNFYWNLYLIQSAVISNGILSLLFFQNMLGFRHIQTRIGFGTVTAALGIWFFAGLALGGRILGSYMAIGMPVGFVLNFAAGIIIVILAARAVLLRVAHSAIVSLGLIFFFIGLGNDIIQYFTSSSGPSLHLYGYLALTLSMATAIARRNAQAHSTAEDLSESLEKKVASRTAEIENLAEISRRINETTDLDIIFEKIFQHLQTEYQVEDLVLQMVDQKRLELYTLKGRSQRNLTAEQTAFTLNLRIPLRPDSGTLYRAFHRQKTLYLPPDPENPDYLTRVDLNPKRPGQSTSELDLSIMRTLELKSLAHFPLLIQGRTIGILWLAAGLHRLSRADIRSIERFCDQIAGALQANELLRETRVANEQSEQARQETEILAELARKANEAQDLQSILEAMSAVLYSRYEIDTFIFAEVNLARDKAHSRFIRIQNSYLPISEIPAAMREISLTPESGTIYHTIRKKKPFYSRRVDPAWLEKSPVDKAIAGIFKFESFVELPLLVEEQVVGLLCCTLQRKRRLSKTDINFLERMAAQVAGAVRAAELLRQKEAARESAQKTSRDMAALNALTQALLAASDRDSILKTTIQHITETLSIPGVIILLAIEKNFLQVAGISRSVHDYLTPESVEKLFAKKWSLDPKIGAKGLVHSFRRKKRIYLSGTEKDLAKNPDDIYVSHELSMNSFLDIPIILDGKSIGVIVCTGLSQPLVLQPAEMDAVQEACNQAAVALRSAQLMEQIKAEQKQAEQSRAETEILAELARKANETHDLDHLMRVAGEALLKKFPSVMTGLWVVDETRSALLVRSGHSPQRAGIEMRQNLPQIIRYVPLNESGGSMVLTFKRGKTLYLQKVNHAMMQGTEVDREIQRIWQFDWCIQLPLFVKNEVVGIFSVSGKKEALIPRSQVPFLEKMAQQVAGAVQAAELLREATDARSRAEAFQAATEAARESSEALLSKILPVKVAEELKREGRVEPLFYDSVSVIFTDFVGFTRASQKMMPHELVEELDGCFSQFDEVAKRNNIEKLKTIGDAYMCAAGVPVINQAHAIDACLAALEFREFMLQMMEVKKAVGSDYWQIRIGIHSGPVTAGVIGNNKFAYDIWGDTVNTASRMESTGEPDKVNISGATYKLVKDFFECEYRGQIEAKGKGSLDMYFLLRIKPGLCADEAGLLPNGKFEMMRAKVADPFLDLAVGSGISTNGLKAGPTPEPGIAEIDRKRQDW